MVEPVWPAPSARASLATRSCSNSVCNAGLDGVRATRMMSSSPLSLLLLSPEVLVAPPPVPWLLLCLSSCASSDGVFCCCFCLSLMPCSSDQQYDQPHGNRQQRRHDQHRPAAAIHGSQVEAHAQGRQQVHAADAKTEAQAERA